MQDQQFTFVMEEYRSLKEEIAAHTTDIRRLETGAILATAAVYAWLAKSPLTSITDAGWWIPVLFPVFGVMRHLALLRRIMDIAHYIRAIENQYCTTAPGGWETFLAGKRKKLPGVAVSVSSWIFWFTLSVITITVGSIFTI